MLRLMRNASEALPAATPSASPPLQRVGRFRIVRELGRGATGCVYLAHDPVIDREVALKTLRHPLTPAQRREQAQHFVNEARAAGRLSHPCIVTIFEAANEGEDAYIAMEYLRGQELSRLLAGGRRFAPKTVALIVKRLAQALDHAHANGVVHRDIKPANIFMLDNDLPKIVDFGIARAPNRVAEGNGGEPYTMFRNNLIGTPFYMSPEQALGKTVDHRTDLYSLGVVMVEMLTGRKPFEAPDTDRLLHQIAFRAPRAPHEADPEIPLLLSQIAMKAMSKRPEKRYQSAADIVSDIKRYLVHESRTRRQTRRGAPHLPRLTHSHEKAAGVPATTGSPERIRLILLGCLAVVSGLAVFTLYWNG